MSKFMKAALASSVLAASVMGATAANAATDTADQTSCSRLPLLPMAAILTSARSSAAQRLLRFRSAAAAVPVVPDLYVRVPFLLQVST